MQLARVVLAAGLLLAACLVYLQLLGPEPQPEKELRLARMGFRERCAGAYRLLRGATRWDSLHTLVQHVAACIRGHMWSDSLTGVGCRRTTIRDDPQVAHPGLQSWHALPPRCYNKHCSTSHLAKQVFVWW